MKRRLRENGLSLALICIFPTFWTGELFVGHRAYNSDRREHGLAPVSLSRYFRSGTFIEATSENWESEFLEMGAFVWLTAILHQKGSPESKDPSESGDRDPPVKRNSPWPARHGGWVLAIYARSLSLAFLFLFLLSFGIHAVGGTWAYNERQVEHGQQAVTIREFLATSDFWFQSLQNWQSEFLGILSFVVLSIFLRQRGSPESKPVTAPHSSNE